MWNHWYNGHDLRYLFIVFDDFAITIDMLSHLSVEKYSIQKEYMTLAFQNASENTWVTESG